jgi:thioredoxin 1
MLSAFPQIGGSEGGSKSERREFLSMKSFRHASLSILITMLICSLWALQTTAGEFDTVPAKGVVTLVVLGTPSCPPCIRMKPTLEKLAGQYAGRAAVVPIDVAIHQDQIVRFGVKAIPVQVFFNSEGREAYRHVGYMSEGSIVDQFKKLGLE